MPARLSLTKAQRDALLTLPDTEEAFVRHYSFTDEDGEILWRYRTPETRLAFALQLCILRYPGRVQRQGEVMPLHLIAFIAEQVGVPPAAIGGFARRPQTRYEHLAALRSQFGFCDLTDATKAELKQWLAPIALKTTDGHAVLVALAEEMRRRRIIIPGVSVVERLAAEAMHTAEKIAVRCERVTDQQRTRMDALLTGKTHRQQSELSWLREGNAKVSGRGFRTGSTSAAMRGPGESYSDVILRPRARGRACLLSALKPSSTMIRASFPHFSRSKMTSESSSADHGAALFKSPSHAERRRPQLPLKGFPLIVKAGR